ncbi:hypothetical protein niasHT_028011 [Heterodera trifolii]|uniref:Uncharacterized protein n=1 Tax=Heterodera trifolii TaxID=157864 RepID=A0ABD2KE84_9BILA
MLRSSRSEFGAADLVPPEVALGMRVHLRQMRFGQPQEYAQMEQNEVRKFLSSKSVHNWISEWNLSHTFSVANRENTLDRRNRKKANFCVQCTGDQIDLALGLRCAAAPSVPPAPLPSPPSVALASLGNGSILACHNSLANARNFPNSLSRPRICHPPSLMNASTNTQTTETTRTSGGTGGRMHVFRRASLLEEYAQKTLEKLEEREEEERQINREKRRKRREMERRGGRGKESRWWRRSKCCGGEETETEESADEQQQRKDFFASAEEAAKSVSCSVDEEQKEEQRTNIVKRFTISNWTGDKATEAQDEKAPKGTKWRRKAKGEEGRGDYDNVPEEWRRTEEQRWEESEQLR